MATTHLLLLLTCSFVLAHGHPTSSLTVDLMARQQPRQTIYPVIQNPYTRAAQDLLLDLRQQIMNRQMKFDEHFKNLLSSSKLSLHNMFVETYGMNYEHNTEIFTTMFEGLEQYYANGDVSLTKFMENFFEQLYQKIFQVLHSGRSFSPSYLECATSQLKNLRPFKDVPEKLIDGIKHAFVAARTFNQALNLSVDIIKEVMKIGQPSKCTHLINEKLLFNTNLSRQNSSSKLPCFSFCEKIISSCTLIENNGSDNIIERWRKYVTSLADLATKLSTSYNIETTIRPLDIQISEAIMNFQENSTFISDYVFQACGGPNPSAEVPGHRVAAVTHENRLARRSANPIPSSPLGHNLRSNQRNNFAPTRARGDTFVTGPLNSQDRVSSFPLLKPLVHDEISPIARRSKDLIDEIKIYILSTKNFWHNLPSSVCTHNLTLGLNALKKQTNCHQGNLSSIELMNYDIRYRTEMNMQINRLDEMRSKIGNALIGEEIYWSNNGDGKQVAHVPGSNYRPMPFSPTTTTTAAYEPEDDTDCSDDENSEDCEGDEDQESDESSTPSSEEDEYTSGDFDDETDNSDDTLDNNADGRVDTTTEPPESNIVDRPPQSDFMDNTLISVPNHPDAQKSAGNSLDPTMSYGPCIAFANLLTVAILLL